MKPPTLPSLALAPAFLLSPGLFAQRGLPDQDELRTRYEKKLKEAWLEKADWNLDYDKARAIAKKEKKLIFAYFTRSYSP